MRDAGADASPTMVRLAVGHENPEPAVLADAVAAARPGKRRWQRIPLFLHVRAVKP